MASSIDRDERIALLNKFFRQLLQTATRSIESMDRLRLSIPEKQEVAGLLETFHQAIGTSKEIDRYVSDARIASEMSE